MTFYFQSADKQREQSFRAAFAKELPDLPFVTEIDDPASVRYLFSWQPPADLAAFRNLEVLFSVSAGVDQFAHLPAHIPLIRMVDQGNQNRVAQYVAMAALACARDLPVYAHQQQDRNWNAHLPRLAQDLTVGILGLGEIGQLCVPILRGLGFSVAGWARSEKTLEGARCLAGPEGLDEILGLSDIVVCLLPLTDATRGLMDAGFFSKMKPGAALVHAGRGAQCDFAALRDVLENGHLRSAVLDVFDPEPLPPDHWIWTMPNCLVTPHVAGRIDHVQSAGNVIENIRRHQAGQPLLWRVDRQKGY